MNKITKILLVLLSVLGIMGGCVYATLNQITEVKIDKSNEALGIEDIQDDITPIENTDKKSDEPKGKNRNDIINIALFGLDRRNEKEVSRSDAIMILTVDFKHKKIKLSSIMRDTYVEIENYKAQKINHAYALGGAQLAIKTINQNFGTDIRHFASVDFFALEEIIDILGGVNLPIKKSEISNINTYIKEVATLSNKEPEYLTEEGEQVLNGLQAVAYARIRSVGNGDFERTERQRRVLTQLIATGQEKGISKIPELATKVLPLVETNFTKSEILEMAFDYFRNQPMTIEQKRFPIDNHYKTDMSTGVWYIKADFEETKKDIYEFIYEDNVEINNSI